jgi:hypothetical protein
VKFHVRKHFMRWFVWKEDTTDREEKQPKRVMQSTKTRYSASLSPKSLSFCSVSQRREKLFLPKDFDSLKKIDFRKEKHGKRQKLLNLWWKISVKLEFLLTLQVEKTINGSRKRWTVKLTRIKSVLIVKKKVWKIVRK